MAEEKEGGCGATMWCMACLKQSLVEELTENHSFWPTWDGCHNYLAQNKMSEACKIAGFYSMLHSKWFRQKRVQTAGKNYSTELQSIKLTS